MTLDRPGPRFGLLLPPGWAHLRVGADVDRRIDGLVEEAFARRSADEAPQLRRELRDRLRGTVREAAAHGVLDVYFPFTEEAGAPAPVSLAVAAFDVPEDGDPMATVLAIAAKDPTAQAVEIDGVVALRTTRTGRSAGELAAAAAQSDDGEPLMLLRREVRYVLGTPDDGRRWLSFVLVSVLPDDAGAQELADAFEELFDAMMPTFSWEEDA